MSPVSDARAAVRRSVSAVPLLVAAVLTLVLAGCTATITGRGSNGTGGSGGAAAAGGPVAPNAHLDVIGTDGGAFDQTAENAISDVEAFWRASFPGIAGGAALPPLTGKLYSIDGADVSSSDRSNACLRSDPKSIVDNAFYCQLDDSIAWDRNPDHLVPVLGAHYSSLLTAAVFAHEFGHAIQNRLRIFEQNPPTIYTESQADCAAGAFLATVLSGKAPHFRATSAQLDTVLLGYLNVRDPPPTSTRDIDHGNGFDRLNAVADGIDKGPSFCFSSTYFTRKFTERPFVTDQDYAEGGNEPFAQVVDPSPAQPNGSGGGGLQPSLEQYWSAAAKSVGKTWTPVTTKEASSLPCAATRKFGYCPNGNTVYFETAYARSAYNSLPDINVDPSTGDVTVVDNAPADYALGTLFAYGWGFAVRHQLFGGSIDDQAALLAATCYAGAYSASINVAPTTQGLTFTLSPPDMDEAAAAVLKLVPQQQAYGARGTTGLQRIQAFDKGYFNGLSSC